MHIRLMTDKPRTIDAGEYSPHSCALIRTYPVQGNTSQNAGATEKCGRRSTSTSRLARSRAAHNRAGAFAFNCAGHSTHASLPTVGMHFLDTLSLTFSFLIALLFCCMLLKLARLGASLKLFDPKQAPPHLPHPPQSYLLKTRSTLRTNPANRFASRPTTATRPYYGHLYTRPRSHSTMFNQAVSRHNAAIPPPAPSIPSKQQSLGTSFLRNGLSQNKATNTLASATKQNGASRTAHAGSFARGQHNQGTKRSASGLAKALDFQDDLLSYPSLSIGGQEKENDFAIAHNAQARNNSTGLATALFDEDDFDSDIDLDVEDPATKGTVTYPKLPQAFSESRDSGYNPRPQTSRHSEELDSSQPISWTQSSPSHMLTPKKPEPPKPRTKRAFLPWSQNQQAANTQDVQDRIEEHEEEEETVRPKKKQSIAPKAEVTVTPKPKTAYAWNTTASALKLQQKNFREQNKKAAKENDTSVDDLKEAVNKRKKNAVARIFLSEEQQHVLSLVTEHKKSVFFTGSAGKPAVQRPANID